jgi:hypothetical protein
MSAWRFWHVVHIERTVEVSDADEDMGEHGEGPLGVGRSGR